MIAALTGRLLSKTPTDVVLDVQGVGYEVQIPLSTFYALPETQQSFQLHIYTHVREDCIQLFGFASLEEKRAFTLLTSVSGIGPKLALSVLSTLSVADLISAIRAGDIDKLATVPGVGKKSASRMALELKDKADRFGMPQSAKIEPALSAEEQPHDDAISALVNLGYKPAEVKDVIKRLQRPDRTRVSLELLIRDALKELAKGAIRS